MTCKNCLHVAVCARYSATGGMVRKCQHFAKDINVPTWIPVAERLPKEDGSYVVVTKTGAVTTARYYTEMTFLPTHYRPTEYTRKAQWQTNRQVTYWLPLPEPPKGEAMTDLEMMRDILKMHCMLRPDGWECDTMGENKCAECLAKHLINHGVTIRPAMPGCDDKYNIAEMAFHNGESRMKERMVDMLLGMQVTAKSEEHSQLREILQRVREL